MTCTPSTLAELLADCDAHGIRLALADGGGLEIDAPQDALTPDILARLKAHKGELVASIERFEERAAIMEFDAGLNRHQAERLATLRAATEVGRATTVDPTHPLATFDWDTAAADMLGNRIIRDGVEHQSETFPSGRSWLHVSGERICADCWPCTDPIALAIAPSATTQVSGVS